MSALNENAQKWVDALRSGKYQQTREKLSDGAGFCCLGVACEVAIDSGLDVPKRPPGWMDDRVTYVQSDAYLPRRVAKWLGMKSPRGKFGPKRNENLAALNDKESMSFEEIAGFIEAHADELGVSA